MSPYLRSVEGDPSQPRPGTPVRILVDGESLEARPGQTVAAALMVSGRDSWRATRGAERPRGVFCGIGACFDCLVVVNGTPDVRACQRTIRPGDTITTQQGAVLPTTSEAAGTATPTAATKAEHRATHFVVVVGAGPAGVGAALAAADAGVEVLLVDAGRAVGGQFHRQLPVEFKARRPERLQHGWGEFSRQRDRIANHSRITHLTESSVWAIERDAQSREEPAHKRKTTRLWLQQGPADAVGRRVWPVDAAAVVLATGAYDRVLPFPGWDLPGVYSAGAAQALAKGQRIAVGKRVVVAGTGPFLLPVAEALIGVGAEVVALLEANRPSTVLKGWRTDPLVAPSKLTEALGYGALLARHRIPLKHGRTVIAAHGRDRVESVTTAKLDHHWNPIRGTEQQVEVDAVCLGFGFTAQLELAISAHCDLGIGPDGGPAVIVDENQQTSTPGVFAAGELTGIGGAALAAAEGEVAGAAAALSLQATSRPPSNKAVTKARRFAAALAKAYPVKPGWQTWSDDTTVVCRCEEVTRADLQEAVTQREATGRSLKLTCRVGLGLCQGRVCARTVADLATHDIAVPAGQTSSDFKRPVGQPVRLGDLAAAEIQEDL
ncbi:pyruvate/2-oxoglutarate dehydrogenase complex dihydrolipoamide dehydrogenase (E3) component [Kribbella sp. VKM Ac-2568]|nr:pyruvate/2-oxoglutarate dehydrogenase complex dihydrolipoamide dehydrogenase (E3) component [Kribbella sp. VKM Ac-2568]